MLVVGWVDSGNRGLPLSVWMGVYKTSTTDISRAVSTNDRRLRGHIFAAKVALPDALSNSPVSRHLSELLLLSNKDSGEY